jgi:hypothetical protein
MKSVHLEQLSCKDVAAYLESDSRIPLPVGSTGQHGALAPLGTDTYVAAAVAQDAGRRPCGAAGGPSSSDPSATERRSKVHTCATFIRQSDPL